MNMWLVGAGYWGSKLLHSLNKLGVQGQVIDIKNGQSIDDINTQDPVILATPLWQHYDQTMTLLSRGHDIYIEKPAAETAPQVAKIKEMALADQLVMVGHIFIHHPQMQLIKDLIKANTIGALTHVTSRRLNWGIYQTRTTPILSLAAHDISILQHLTGNQPTVSHAHGWHLSTGNQYDRVWFSGQSHGISYDIDVSWCWPVRTRQTVLIGTRGQIVWDQDENTVTVWHNQIQDNRAVVGNNTVYSYEHSLSPLEHELSHWIDCVKNRQQPTTSCAEAYHVAVTIDLVHKVLGSTR